MKYLILRRITQLTILFLYFAANYWGWTYIVKGDLSFSMLLNTIPLTDPFAALQMFVAGVVISADMLLGALIIALFYFIVGGRAFCSWVCPINMVTDLASYLRRVFKFDEAQKQKQPIGRKTRYYVLALSLILSALMGVAAFEFVSPISMMHRGIIFGIVLVGQQS